MHTYGKLDRDLRGFLEAHLADLENEERVEALTWYCQGLGLELPQKTLLGIAARIAPDNVQAVRQRMQRGIQRGRFDHRVLFARLQQTVFADGRARAYCFDDTGFEKKGKHSVGVQRQYSGTLGKIGNCQVAVSLHAASDDFSACLGAQLYLPESWAEDEKRRSTAGIPDDIGLDTKPTIALRLLKEAADNGAPKLPVLADAGYGDSRDFRESINDLGMHYVVAISSNTNVWPPDARPERPKRTGKRGRPQSFERDPAGAEPIRVDKVAARLWEDGRFRSVTWRPGRNGPLRGRFCAIRVRSAERRTKGKLASTPIWLLVERDETQKSNFKCYLSSLPTNTSVRKLVGLAKMRWRIERDYQDMKQKLGLDSYEGRTWGGFHRHFAMVALVHAFISLNREIFSPGSDDKHVDVARLSPCPTCGAHALDRPLPNLQQTV